MHPRHDARHADASAPRVIAVVNQKGGVGKTTTAVNLAASVAAAEQRTLLVDLDPQGNASSAASASARARVERSVYDALIGRATLARRASPPTEIPPLDVAPAHAGSRRRRARARRRSRPRRASCKRRARRAARGEARSSTSSSTARRRSACSRSTRSPRPTRVLVPLQCEYYALEGLTHLMATIDRVKNGMNPELEVEGIVLTMFDPRNNLAHQVADEVKRTSTCSTRSSRATCGSARRPRTASRRSSTTCSRKGAQGYLSLARELLAREAGAQQRRDEGAR